MSQVAPLEIQTTGAGGMTVLALNGELDLQFAHGVSDAVDAVLADSPVGLALDLRGLEFMDSSGIHLLIRSETRCRAAGVGFCLIGGTRSVRRTIELCGLKERFEMLGDIADLGEPDSDAGSAPESIATAA